MLTTPILIVGAGPSGLMLSAQLHRYGVAHVIVDRKGGITNLSKALGVQARTLEQYRQLGIANEAIAEGFVAETVRFIVNGRVRAQLPFGEIGTGLSPYPYIFILEQSKNEALLYEHIVASGGDVMWGTEVTELRCDNTDATTGYTGTLQRSDGSQDNFTCQYLIGCDGASSSVRRFLDMPFLGGMNEQLFFVADVDMDIELAKHGLLLVTNNSEFMAFFPMPKPRQYRAIGILPDSVVDPENVLFDEIREHIETNLGLPVNITGNTWQSSYRVHHRIVESFRSDDAFLVGDAAHIHSPAGGQGMNTGLGDAVNLGWKLAAVVNGWSEPTILDSYNEERRPFAVQLVQTTDRVFTMMVSKSRIARFVRTRVIPNIVSMLLKFKVLRRLVFKTISQTRIAYHKSSLSNASRGGSVRSGDRFPWFEWDGGNSYEWLSNVGYVVLNLGSMPPYTIPNWEGPFTEVKVTGEAAVAAVAAGLPRRGCVVVRPDMHVSRIIE